MSVYLLSVLHYLCLDDGCGTLGHGGLAIVKHLVVNTFQFEKTFQILLNLTF